MNKELQEREERQARRQQAKDNSEKLYVGLPCINGHGTTRKTINNTCPECERLSAVEHRKSNREAIRIAHRKYYALNPEKFEVYREKARRKFKEDPERQARKQLAKIKREYNLKEIAKRQAKRQAKQQEKKQAKRRAKKQLADARQLAKELHENKLKEIAERHAKKRQAQHKEHKKPRKQITKASNQKLPKKKEEAEVMEWLKKHPKPLKY